MAKSKKPSRGDGYEVGYRKPPKASQFKKGQSGNPGGRKKGSLNLKTVYSEVYGEIIELTLNGEKRRVTGLAAMVIREFHLGLSGDGRVIGQVMNRFERFQATEPSEGLEETTEDDRAIIERAIRRRGSASPVGSDQPPDAGSEEGDPDIDDGDADV